MRILRVTQKIYPDSSGGGAYHVHALSRDQAAMGHDVTLLAVDEGVDEPHVQSAEGYTVVRYPALASPLGNAVSAGLAQYLAWDDPDVIHAHSHLYFATNLAALRRRLGGPPLAITNHGLYSQTAPERVFDGYLRTLGRWTFDGADTVFCYTPTDRDRLRDLGVSADVTVVPNGIDTTRFTPDGPASEVETGGGCPAVRSDGTAVTETPVRADGTGDLVGDGVRSGGTDGRSARGPVVLFVGRLVEGKRPADAVRAFARARTTLDAAGDDVPVDGAGDDGSGAAASVGDGNSNGNARLVMVGDGPLRQDLEDLASELGVSASVSFLGHLPYDEMPRTYRAADVLLLPSRAEGLPRTVLEALASATPAVTSALDQLVPLLGDAGRTVPVGNVDGFATALVEVLSDERRRARLGRQGRELVASTYDWASTVERTTERLEELV